jgi:hypothetical protein
MAVSWRKQRSKVEERLRVVLWAQEHGPSEASQRFECSRTRSMRCWPATSGRVDQVTGADSGGVWALSWRRPSRSDQRHRPRTRSPLWRDSWKPDTGLIFEKESTPRVSSGGDGQSLAPSSPDGGVAARSFATGELSAGSSPDRCRRSRATASCTGRVRRIPP